jgi:hypothetical protein
MGGGHVSQYSVYEATNLHYQTPQTPINQFLYICGEDILLGSVPLFANDDVHVLLPPMTRHGRQVLRTLLCSVLLVSFSAPEDGML